jgi:hypothetical protein
MIGIIFSLHYWLSKPKPFSKLWCNTPLEANLLPSAIKSLYVTFCLLWLHILCLLSAQQLVCSVKAVKGVWLGPVLKKRILLAFLCVGFFPVL